MSKSVTKQKTSGKTSKTVTPKVHETIKEQLDQLQKKEDIMMQKLDRVRGKMDWAYRHPFRFMLGRIYHQYIKRDQKNV